MAWAIVAKPTSSPTWDSITGALWTAYIGIAWDSITNWAKVAKPTTSNWTPVAKPSSNSWVSVAKPT